MVKLDGKEGHDGDEGKDAVEADETVERAGEGGAQDAEEDIERLRERLGEREERIEELESRLKRVKADFENYKKRSNEKVERAERRAREDLLDDLLGVRNDLERALGTEGDVRDGVEMTLDNLDSVLEDHDVERVQADDFDPEVHEALARVDSDEHDEGEIVEVYEPGFRMNGRVVRPAKVTVASGGGEGDGDDRDERADDG